MKLKLLLLAIVVGVLVAEVSTEKLRKYKKVRHYKRPAVTTSTTTENEFEGDVISLLEEDEAAATSLDESSSQDEKNDKELPPDNPCAEKHCGAGRVCQVDSKGAASCVCIPYCYEEMDPRRKNCTDTCWNPQVCSNHNETWGSDCEVYQMRCMCDKEMPECLDDKYKHLHIEYYGSCREMPECTKEEMDDFPRRMRDWLFQIMRDMAEREELTPHYLGMEREAESNLTRRWSNAAVWKWCDLDGHPHDRSVSRHELFPIRAPLMVLEHCMAPFLNACDADDDHRITLQEWGNCLELDSDIIEEKCEDIKSND